MLDKLIQNNSETKEISEADVNFIRSAEIIFQWTDHTRFLTAMARIKRIVSNLSPPQKQLIAQYYAMIVYKLQIELLRISEDRPKDQKRDISNIAKWTGLKSLLISNYISSTNQESVVQMVWVNPEEAIHDMQLIRGLYRGIVDGTAGEMKEMNAGQKLYWQMKAAKVLLETHTNPRKKPSALINIENNLNGGDTALITTRAYDQILYEASATPSLNDPIMRRRIEAGEKILSEGADIIDAEGVDETD